MEKKAIEFKARQRLRAFLLRHGRVYRPGKSRWTQARFRWLQEQRFDHPSQQVVFEEYVHTVTQAQARVAGLEDRMHDALASWSLRPVVEALMALRGVDVITAMTVLAELGDLARFETPRQLMSFLGLVPNERASGSHRPQGWITKSGNSHVQRVLMEAAEDNPDRARDRVIAARGLEPLEVLPPGSERRAGLEIRSHKKVVSFPGTHRYRRSRR